MQNKIATCMLRKSDIDKNINKAKDEVDEENVLIIEFISSGRLVYLIILKTLNTSSKKMP